MTGFESVNSYVKMWKNIELHIICVKKRKNPQKSINNLTIHKCFFDIRKMYQIVYLVLKFEHPVNLIELAIDDN